MRCSWIIVSLCTATFAVAGCGDDRAAPGPAGPAVLYWTDQHDSGTTDGGPSAPRTRDIAYAAATCNGRVFAVGTIGPDGSSSNDDLVLRAYTADAGTLLWQDIIATDRHDGGRLVACHGSRVFVGGRLNQTAIYRGYDASDGRVLWTHTIEDTAETSAVALSADTDAVFRVTLVIDRGMTTDTTGLVQAIDPQSGATLWEDRHEGAGPLDWANDFLQTSTSRVCLAHAQAIAESPRSIRCLVRTTGALAWTATGDQDGESEASAVIDPEDSGHLLSLVEIGDRRMVSAYRIRDGELLWQREYPEFTGVFFVRQYRGQVFVAGVEFFFEEHSDGDIEEHDVFFTEALTEETGEVRWQDRHVDEQVRNAATSDDRLIVAGTDWQTRVYDIHSGRLVIDEPRFEDPDSRWMWGIAADEQNWFLVGAVFASLDGPRDYDFTIRAYGSGYE